MKTYTLGSDHDHPTPPGAKRFGWYSVAWTAWGLGFALIEGTALYRNARGGKEDYEHRTLTENIRFLAATDRDGRKAKFKKFRRVALLGAAAWEVAHFLTNGDYV